LPACPKCGNKEIAPTRVFSVIVEPAKGERGMTERKVGMYTCSKCGTKFPAVISRQHYLIVAEEQMNSMQDELKTIKKDNGELKSLVDSVGKEHAQLQSAFEKHRKEGEVRELEVRLREIETYVDYLRKQKGELEQKVSKLH
jgi:septal ring factor EnvC (AmiA/AmiB activator)